MATAVHQARLQWGDVALLPAGAPSGLPYRIEASADGTNWGNPEAIITKVQSRLQDGSLARVDSYDNREAPIYLRVTADTYDGLAAGEAALVAETRRPGYNTLSWTPNRLLARVSVFDVVYATLDFDFDDFTETVLKRRFVATLNCLPFPRSDTQVVAAAIPPPGGAGDTSIDAMSATTGWTGRFWSPARKTFSDPGTALTPTLSSGTVVITASTPAQLAYALIKTFSSQSLATQPFVFVDWKWTGLGNRTLQYVKAYFNGQAFSPIASVPSPTAGYTRTYFNPGLASFTDFQFEIRLSAAVVPVSPSSSLVIDQISRTDIAPSFGTRKQLVRTLPVAGTVRTEGQVAIESGGAIGLGEVLAYFYTGSIDYTPPLRQFFFAGGTTSADALAVSGFTNMLDTLVEYRIPASKLPAGNYRLYARLIGTGTGPVTLNIAAYTRIGSNDTPGTITFSSNITINSTTSFEIFDLGGLSLPATLLPDAANATVRLTIVDASTAGIDVVLDEAWLFNQDIGTLTHVNCNNAAGSGAASAGGPSRRLFLDPAMLTNDGQDAIFRAHSADRSDAFHPAEFLKAWTPPLFEPPLMNVFTVSTLVDDVAVELRHYPRFLHNVGEVA